MRTTSDLRRMWDPACEREMTTLLLHSGARVTIAAVTADAFRAVDVVMQAHGYAPRTADTGGFNCRRITGGTGYSLHAYGVAVDYNWNSNPYRSDGKLITDMPREMVAAIKAIRTTAGVQVFRWGGDYTRAKDAMHFEVVASPRELGAGIDAPGAASKAPDPSKPASWPVIEHGARGPAVRALQERLIAAGFACGAADGVFGKRTGMALRDYQRSRALDVDGVAGLQTWTALLTDQPPTPEDRSPVKVTTRPAKKASDAKVPATCKRRSTGKAVTRLQARLNELGFDCGSADGRFGARTESAVKLFQSARGLKADGVVGPKTWAVLLET